MLLVDTDPHASLTTYLGYDSDTVESSLFDLFQLRDFTPETVAPLTLQTEVEGIDIIPCAHVFGNVRQSDGKPQRYGLNFKARTGCSKR